MRTFFRETFLSKTLAEWRPELEQLEICFGPVNYLDEAREDPQVRHRGMIVDVNGMPAPAPPIKLSDTPASIRTAPPKFGEHTDAVLAGLGFDADAIARLRREGV